MGEAGRPPNARVVEEIDEERFREMFFRVLAA
jgi:inosine-uridine nucleoside N-ribohydrolase